ncbi:MAG TPA: carboxy-S-adenosyl-L-methionine synthase CmoA [Xanthomonadales bacterium]|nr:carboxy-S-adenosyl-L-methionine synthase CmoA [Xanthomonadales bacterium]
MSDKDTLYRDESIQADQFVFDDRVVRVFPDMIRRSVPGYGLVIPSIALLAREYAQPESNIYDLGCSLGGVSFAIMDAVTDKNCRLTAVDNSAEMIEKISAFAAKRQGKTADSVDLQIVEADVLDVAIEDASFVVLNFTLQFIDPSRRLGLLERICGGMRPGGALVLSEKLCFDDPREQDLHNAWHLNFKRAQGYSELEIARKRDALEDTLIPDSMKEHLERLSQAGFSKAYQWFQCFNFASIVAIR